MDSSSEKVEWIAAHLIYVLKTEEDGRRLVEENVVLFRSSFEGEAEQLAIKYGRFDCECNPPNVFAGIRKLMVTHINFFEPEHWHEDGVELTYSYFEVAGEEELAELIGGGNVALNYIE